jgi:hypothetical protein
LFDRKFLYSTLVSIFVLNGCGGSGSGSDVADSITAPQTSSPTPVILQGIFVDSAVEGLAFNTASQSGKTNAQGQFSYLAGEEVVFQSVTSYFQL